MLENLIKSMKDRRMIYNINELILTYALKNNNNLFGKMEYSSTQMHLRSFTLLYIYKFKKYFI